MKKTLNDTVKNIAESLETPKTKILICESDFETRAEFEAEAEHYMASLRDDDPRPLLVYMDRPIEEYE